MDIFIYEINDVEFVAASSQVTAALEYAKFVGHSLERAIADGAIDVEKGYPRKLTAAEMRRIKFQNTDDEDFGKPNYKPRSFRQELDRQIAEGRTFPKFFATSDF